MAPASIRYGREIGVMMLVLVVAWAYCLVSPILIVVAAIYFMSSWVVWRWQVIYVYVRCYEGGGDIWRSLVACIMCSMLIFVFFMSCLLVAKQAFYQAAIMFLVLPVIIVAFWCACLTDRVAVLPCRTLVPLHASCRNASFRVVAALLTDGDACRMCTTTPSLSQLSLTASAHQALAGTHNMPRH